MRHQSRNQRVFVAAFLGVLGCGVIASACTVPVFRYALDRWESDAFRLVVPGSWMTDREKLKLLVPLRGNGLANVVVEESTESGLSEARLLFPRHDGVLWEGGLDADSLSIMLDSPARRELLARLLAGDSVIWVVATTKGDRGETDRVAARLRFLEQVASLPVQDPNDPDSKLGPGPPLLLKFSVLPLSLDDPAERLLAAMLAGPEHGDFVAEDISFAAPVFGRGRVLGSWALDQLDDASIEDASLFLTGRCSCRVKNENPGWDLLIQADWEASLSAINAEEETPAAGTEPIAASETIVFSATPQTPAPAGKGISWYTLAGIGLISVLVIGGGLLWRVR